MSLIGGLLLSPGTKAAFVAPSAAKAWSRPRWRIEMGRSTAKVCVGQSEQKRTICSFDVQTAESNSCISRSILPRSLSAPTVCTGRESPVILLIHTCFYRLLREELRPQGIRLRSGCRGSGSLPVKPEATAHLDPKTSSLPGSFHQYLADITLPFRSSYRRLGIRDAHSLHGVLYVLTQAAALESG